MSIPPQYPAYPPMTFGQILERIFRLLRANFKLLIGIAALPGAAIVITYGTVFAAAGVVIFTTQQGGKPANVVPLVVAAFIAYFAILLINLVVFALYLAAACYAAVLADCGSRVTIRESCSVAWSRAGHYVLLILTMYAVCFLPALLLELPMFAAFALMGTTQTAPSTLMTLLFAILFILGFGAMIAGMVIALRLSLAFPASVFESLKVRDALKRSWALTRGAIGRIFLVLLVIYAALYVALMVVMMAAMSVGAISLVAFSGTVNHPSMRTTWILGAGAAIVYLVMMAVFIAFSWAGFSTAFAVIYNDQRRCIDGPPANSVLAGAQI